MILKMLTETNFKIALQMLDFTHSEIEPHKYKHETILINVYFFTDAIYYKNLFIKRTQDLTPILQSIMSSIKNVNRD